MPSNKDRLKELANTARRIAGRMPTQAIADRFAAIADDYDRQAQQASDAEMPDLPPVEVRGRPNRGERAPE